MDNSNKNTQPLNMHMQFGNNVYLFAIDSGNNMSPMAK